MSTPETTPVKWQFSLGELFYWTTVIAIVLGAIQAVGIFVLAVLLVLTPGIIFVHDCIWHKRPLFVSKYELLVSWIVIGFVFYLLLPAVGTRRTPSTRSMCQNNLRQIGLALQNYNDQRNTLPLIANYDSQGTPLLSWRVHILPFMESNDLYEQFHREEAWDSPHNATLISRPPSSMYLCPSDKAAKSFHASYLAIAGPDTCWPAKESISLNNLPDGQSNTLLIVERKQTGITWSEPRDTDEKQVLPQGVNRQTGAKEFSANQADYNHGNHLSLGLKADGSVATLSRKIDPDVLQQLTNRRDGKPENFP